MLAYARRDPWSKNLIIGVFNGAEWVERDPIMVSHGNYTLRTTTNTKRFIVTYNDGYLWIVEGGKLKNAGEAADGGWFVELEDGLYSVTNYRHMEIRGAQSGRKWTVSPPPIGMYGFNFSRSLDDMRMYIYGINLAQSIPDDPNIHIILKSHDDGHTNFNTTIVCNDGHSIMLYDLMADTVLRYDSRMDHDPIWRGNRPGTESTAIFLTEYLLVTIGSTSIRMVDLRNMSEYHLPAIPHVRAECVFGIY